MAYDRDELYKRRHARDAQRKKRMEEQRRLKIRLAAAAVILLICGLAIYFLTRGSDDASANGWGETLPTAAPTEPTERQKKEPTTTITIRAGGDLNITDKVVASGRTTLGYDFTKSFLDVAGLFAEADLSMLNIEGIFVGEPYGTNSRSAPRELLQALNACGVDLIQAANSYSIYDGITGLATSLNAIRSAGLEPLGAYATPEEFEKNRGYVICTVRGIKVAVVAFTKGMDGLGLPAGSEDCVNVLYEDYSSNYHKVDTEGITALLEEVEDEDPDITIAMLHWGSEYNDTISETQKKIASVMLEEGVDIILGTHSHLVHEIVYDKAEDTLIAYSLGDFFGDGEKGGSNYSIILETEITKDNDTGETRISDYDYVPIYTLSEDECDGHRRVVRIQQAMEAYELNFVDKITKEAYDSMQNSLNRINARVKGK